MSLAVTPVYIFFVVNRQDVSFFLISKKIILKKHKRTKTTQRIQRGEQKRKKKRTENKNTKKPTKTNYKGEN